MQNMDRKIFYSGHAPVEEISYLATQETKDEIFKKIIDWIRERDAWSGEMICQDDNCQIDAPVLLADIVDDILQIEIKEI